MLGVRARKRLRHALDACAAPRRQSRVCLRHTPPATRRCGCACRACHVPHRLRAARASVEPRVCRTIHSHAPATCRPSLSFGVHRSMLPMWHAHDTHAGGVECHTGGPSTAKLRAARRATLVTVATSTSLVATAVATTAHTAARRPHRPRHGLAVIAGPRRRDRRRHRRLHRCRRRPVASAAPSRRRRLPIALVSPPRSASPPRRPSAERPRRRARHSSHRYLPRRSRSARAERSQPARAAPPPTRLRPTVGEAELSGERARGRRCAPALCGPAGGRRHHAVYHAVSAISHQWQCITIPSQITASAYCHIP